MSKDYKSFIEAFKANYNQGLPGRKAQHRMKPYVGLDRNIDIPSPPHAKQSAVLALFVPIANEAHLLLTKRSPYEGVHGGQISFPGGKKEESDTDLIFTALRETNEEVGIVSNQIQLIGELTDLYVMASNFNVRPFVGYLENRPNYIIDPLEVDHVIEEPITTFLNERFIKEKVMASKIGLNLNAPYFDLQKGELWGATAMMISELMAICKKIY